MTHEQSRQLDTLVRPAGYYVSGDRLMARGTGRVVCILSAPEHMLELMARGRPFEPGELEATLLAMNSPPPPVSRVRFRRRLVLRAYPPYYHAHPSPALRGSGVADTSRWYGVDRGRSVQGSVRPTAGDRAVLVTFSDRRLEDWRAEVGPGDVEPDAGPPVACPLHPLRNGFVGADLLDPVDHLYRHPDERAFWAAVLAAPWDDLPRAVYADWLQEHDDPHDWVFRSGSPFSVGGAPAGWGKAARGTVLPDCGGPNLLPYLGLIREPGYPVRLSDGSPLPEFVGYLLAVRATLDDPEGT